VAHESCIPHRIVSDSHYNVPGWNKYARERHDIARVLPAMVRTG
jgi:hypothetical protein